MSSILLVIFGISLLIGIAIILYLLMTSLNNSKKQGDLELQIRQALESQQKLFETQRIRYEESSRRLLDITRNQYEQQITRLEDRLEKQRIELQRTSALEFENLANLALERQAEKLSEENRDELSAILSPLRQNLGEFRRAVDDSYIKENSGREALSRQIDALIKANSEIGSEARRLSDALRGNTRLQGQWGETVLERLLDAAGFEKGIHYVLQATSIDGATLKDDDGTLLRPDLVFFLPGEVRVVIDAKTSMTAYLNYCEASSEKEIESALKAHLESVKNHIDKLGRSKYHKSIKGAVEHTLMFMPNDGAFLAALRADSTLPEYAMKHRVVMVSPAHLLSVLNLIAQLIRIDKQNRNAEEIARLGGLIHDRIAALLVDFDQINNRLESARNAVAKCRQTMTEGPTSISARAQKLKDLGAKSNRSLPDL
ncbi:MAG: DNA recombination protein RmuC [Muribaculaceae bacterium]|nr:DNA recombination protein RmuC [Muribaculaceae bacterium]